MMETPSFIPTDKTLRTFTCEEIDFENPMPRMFNMADIAHALARMPRFSGHTPTFYSVAQHSVLVASIVPPEMALTGLLHDASEAYMMDIPTPLKRLIPEYYEIENRVMRAIATKFNFVYPLPQIVKDADREILRIEWEQIMLKPELLRSFHVHLPEKAETQFLSMFYRLIGER